MPVICEEEAFMRIALAVFLCLSIPMAAVADEEDSGGKSAWTIDDVIKIESASGFEFSPDGKTIVWSKRSPGKEKDTFVYDLYLSSATGEMDVIQLTRGDDNDTSPQWRPDGKMIAFISNRKGEGKEESRGAQIWLINPFGGEPWQLTSLERGVNGFEWLDNERMLILAREDAYLRENQLKEKKDDTIVVEDPDAFYPTRLFEFSVKDKKLQRLTDNALPIRGYALSHNKRYIVTVHPLTPYVPDPKNKPKYYLRDLQEGTAKEIFPDPLFYPSGFAWALDDFGFYFRRTHTSDYVNQGAGARFLYWYDLESGEYEQVPLEHEWGLGRSFAVTPDGFIASLAAGYKFAYARYTREGDTWKKEMLEVDDIDHLYNFSLAKDGITTAVVFSWADNPPKYYNGKLDGAGLAGLREFVSLNEPLRNKQMARYEVVRWTGALDEEVDGILYYPHNYEAGKRYPLVLQIHGGPTGTDTIFFEDRWSCYPNLMTGKGAFVLRVNYHGSGNYGQAWAESISGGKYYELELPDIINGADMLIEKGMVDPDKQGIIGWSNGAILGIALVLEYPDRFKAVAPGAGEVNWSSDYGNCMFGPTFDNYYFGGAPWEVPQTYIDKSPLFHMDKVKTPWIVFFGTQDTNVPTEQGMEQYRALQLLGKAPVRYLMFPGEPHGLRTFTHQRRKMEEEFAWFDKYLFGTYEKPNPAFKEGSPLDIAFKRMKIKVVGEFYGDDADGLLIPEVVKCAGLEVGRFEVTRAQWQRFDSSYRFVAGTGDYPVTGISFERAQAYCEWLSGQTGDAYRLPTATEMEKMLKAAKAAAADENTLDYWAGYKLNPDDAETLKKKVMELGDGPFLLQEVGRMKPGGKAAVFDLGGNAAEWCVGGEGEALVRGGSAIQARDDRAALKAPSSEYVGFRVVREVK